VDNLREKASRLPLSPGVYLMKDKSERVIYVGKAKSLKSRVSSYFRSDADCLKTQKLVEQICEFDYIVTLKELDALVLESSLIKQHRPKYNVLLKDARGFNYVKITGDDFPRLTYTHDATDKTCSYIGPYANGFTIRQSVIDANRIFMLPSCKTFPVKPCLNLHMERCIGVCRGGVFAQDYQKRVKSAIDYIKKGSKESVKRLTAEMNTAAELLDFERAARLRDQITAIKRTESVQQIQSKKLTDYDVIAQSGQAGGVCTVAVIKYSGGRLVDKECFDLGELCDVRGFILEYYRDETPKELYLESEIEDRELIQEFLGTKITIPKRGEGLAQIMLAKANANEFAAQRGGRKSKETAALENLARLLGLTQPPKIIECYDISNIGESVKVGGMVVYKDGKPFKNGYRRFNIKTVDGLDDYACMREIVQRSLAGRGDFGAPYPDLILLDGGKGHVAAVQELNFNVPLFGLVKDNKHKTRAVAAKNSEGVCSEIEIRSNQAVFTFLTKIQEEVHRFSVTFARERHKKSSFELVLTKVPGIGQAKAAALLKHFKTKAALKAASADELRQIAKISDEKSRELLKYIETM
jgi:excinuclease ABC subunit C